MRLWDRAFAPITSIDLTATAAGYAGLTVRSLCWCRELVLIGTKNGEILELAVKDKAHPRPIVRVRMPAFVAVAAHVCRRTARASSGRWRCTPS